MKKLIALFAVLLLAAPAMAADWSFYGSQRMATFYVQNDYGDGVLPGTDQDDDWGLNWNFQGNSRLGARVKADKVTGHIELGLRAAGGASATGYYTNSGDGGDDTVTTRRAYALWKFSDAAGGMSLKVGKDYSPVSNLVSSQTFDSDAGLLGQGDFYGRRPAMLGLNIGAFELAFLTNALNSANNLTPAGTDADVNIPKIEARYNFKLSMFELIPFGGFQYYKISDNASVLTDDLDIYSYVGGLVAKVNIGAFYLAAEGAFGQNWANAGWANGRSTTRFPGLNAASAHVEDGDDVKDAFSWMAMGLVGMKFTDTIKFEAGFGYRSDDPDINDLDPLTSWEAYLNATITLAPGVYLVPEVGYIDYMDVKVKGFDDFDLGNSFYIGAKWQIDF